MSFSKILLDDEILEEDAIESLLFENIEDFVDKPIVKKKRSARVQVDDWKTTWGLWLTNPQINIPNSKIANFFLLRFRVPFILFNEKILKMCKEDNIFDLTYECKNTIPIEFKILACLRILLVGAFAMTTSTNCRQSPTHLSHDTFTPL